MSGSDPKDPAPVDVTDPSPVKVQNTDPIPVEVQNDEPLRVRTEQDKVAATRSTSTEKALAEAKVESDAARATAVVDADILRTDDQRRISGMWERTQQIIALSVVEATLLVILIQVARGDPDVKTALAILFGLANLVIGFYFGRTNHTRVGGHVSDRDAGQGR